MARAIVKDEKRIIGACAYLDGEYGIKDICLGVPCRLGKNGIEQIVELELSKGQIQKLRDCAESLSQLKNTLPF